MRLLFGCFFIRSFMRQSIIFFIATLSFIKFAHSIRVFIKCSKCNDNLEIYTIPEVTELDVTLQVKLTIEKINQIAITQNGDVSANHPCLVVGYHKRN